MSKKLEKLSLPRLTVLELGQHIKTTWEGINQIGENIITDENFLTYISTIESQLEDYDRAMIQQAKSDETAKIVKADKERDAAVSGIFRMLKAYEVSSIEAEHEAFLSLHTVFNTYRGMQSWNFEEETSGIDNLLEDLQGPKHIHIVTLKMDTFVLRLKTANDNFKALFAGRINETATKEVFDLKRMRAEMKATYEDMCNYILLMARALDGEQYNKSLAVINATRKYYADMLARRKSSTPSTSSGTVVPL